MYAAIDLGTNTFHMIIVDIHNGRPKVVFRKRHFVKLAYQSFERIEEEAMDRGVEAILDFKETIDRFNITKYKAYATSIFRIATNGKEYIELLKEKSGLDIDIISGKDEAKLIFYGAKMAGTLSAGYNLIVDIGGGSVEFILCDGEKMIFENSYQIGILKLFHEFEKGRPQDKNSLLEIEKFLEKTTNDLQKVISAYKINSLVGTAGSFDVLRNSMNYMNKGRSFDISPNDFYDIFDSVALTSIEDRWEISWIPRERKKLIVYAFAIIDFALKLSKAEVLRITSYSMKEGMIWELINDKTKMY